MGSADAHGARLSDSTPSLGNSVSTLAPEWELQERRIVEACAEHDVEALAALACLPGGLLTDELRRSAWPILLGFRGASKGPASDGAEIDHEHRDEEQVQLDVNRSFVYYPKGECPFQLLHSCAQAKIAAALNDAELEARRKDLFEVIIPTLRRYPMLCYFQGFHDIAQVMLLVLGKKDATQATSYLSLLRIRDFMLPSLSPSLVHLQLLPAIIFVADADLARHLRDVRPFFALAATLTLYAHEVEDYSQIARLYDFLLAHEAAVSVYLFAVIILSRKEQLLEIPAEESDILNFTLSKLPKPLNLERLIADSIELFTKHPPKKLPFRAWQRISSLSVLKTTQSKSSSSIAGTVRADSDLGAAEQLFLQQLDQLRRQEQRQRIFKLFWRYRRPMAGFLAAALVGALSIWVQRNGFEYPTWIATPLRSYRSIIRSYLT